MDIENCLEMQNNTIINMQLKPWLVTINYGKSEMNLDEKKWLGWQA